MESKRIYLPNIIGRGYKEFWNFQGRYLVVKGSRASKKSTTTSLKIIYNMMKYPGANTLVVRRYFNTLKDSCYTQLKWAINQLGVSHLWKATINPLEITYKPTGQKILFRGLDDPMKITSIVVDTGALCWVWLEEAYQMEKESDFDLIEGSIRGRLPENLFTQFIITMNPWSDRHWIKKRFFDPPNTDKKLALTTNYMCNEFLSENDIELFNSWKEINPRYYDIAGLGNWGIAEGLIYSAFSKKIFNLNEALKGGNFTHIAGLDFGYSNDPTAIVDMYIDVKQKIIYVVNELYQKEMLNTDIAAWLKKQGLQRIKIVADNAEPKSISELRNNGIINIIPCAKGPDSIRNGIQKVQAYTIYYLPNCENLETEFLNYAWQKDNNDNALNKPAEDGFDHLMDALRYAVMEVETNRRIILR